MSGEVLITPCPICGQSALSGDSHQYTCASCGTQVTQRRWLGVWRRKRFIFRTVGHDYRNAAPDLTARSFTEAELAGLAGSCYTDANLEAIAAGDLSRLHLPNSTIAQILFPHTSETCYVQVNDLTRAEGPSLPDGVSKEDGPANQRPLKKLDQGNLFISDLRLIFPSSTHTIIRIDRKLTGICAFSNAVAIQRKGEDTATYFLGLESRNVLLVTAYLQGRLDHLQ